MTLRHLLALGFGSLLTKNIPGNGIRQNGRLTNSQKFPLHYGLYFVVWSDFVGIRDLKDTFLTSRPKDEICYKGQNSFYSGFIV